MMYIDWMNNTILDCIVIGPLYFRSNILRDFVVLRCHPEINWGCDKMNVTKKDHKVEEGVVAKDYYYGLAWGEVYQKGA